MRKWNTVEPSRLPGLRVGVAVQAKELYELSPSQPRFRRCSAFSPARWTPRIQVVHRDIKLENLLLQKKSNLKSIKLADMGFAVRLDETGHYYSMAGTPAYLSPEMVRVIQGRFVDAYLSAFLFVLIFSVRTSAGVHFHTLRLESDNVSCEDQPELASGMQPFV